jgi:hypothetical protein
MGIREPAAHRVCRFTFVPRARGEGEGDVYGDTTQRTGLSVLFGLTAVNGRPAYIVDVLAEQDIISRATASSISTVMVFLLIRHRRLEQM